MMLVAPLISRPSVASSSKILFSASRRTYASSPASNPHLVQPADSRTDTIRQALYPPDSFKPTSSSPTGAHHPQHLERIHAVIQDAEAHETIDRAWKLFQREKREYARRSLEARYQAMVSACEELDRITSPEHQENGEEAHPRYIYDRAMSRPSGFPVEAPKDRKGSEAKWLEARIDGLVPREAWVPTETRGKGWNYDWKRPGTK